MEAGMYTDGCSSDESEERNLRVTHIVTANVMMETGLKLFYTERRIERVKRDQTNIDRFLNKYGIYGIERPDCQTVAQMRNESLDSILVAMQMFPHDESVQRSACILLKSIAYEPRSLQKLLKRKDNLTHPADRIVSPHIRTTRCFVLLLHGCGSHKTQSPQTNFSY
jgi:hypothetical protein